MKNNFLRIGLTGLFITFVLYVILAFSTDITFTSMLAFYIVWFVFISIGIGQNLTKKHKETA
jgi:hypothetical protein